MGWSPDNNWSARVLEAMADPYNPDNKDFTKDALNQVMALEYAVKVLRSQQTGLPRPVVTTLCGSTRFPDAFALANMHLSMLGRVVIGLGMMGHADVPAGAKFLTSDGDEKTPEKQGLDQLHFRKIEMSDGIYVVNVGGYIGSSTAREVAYAQQLGKTVEYMFPVK
jgi:hypothetical protein